MKVVHFVHEIGFAALHASRRRATFVEDHFRTIGAIFVAIGDHFRTKGATFAAMPPSTRLWRIWITAVEAVGANFALR